MADTTIKRSNPVPKIILIILLAGILIMGIWYAISNVKSSEGTRAGVLIKFSQKGVIIKTYEGELNIGGMNTVPNTAQANQIWEFSVRDKATADKLMQMAGRKVSLHYSEVVNSMPWQGQTNYFVDGAEVIP